MAERAQATSPAPGSAQAPFLSAFPGMSLTGPHLSCSRVPGARDCCCQQGALRPSSAFPLPLSGFPRPLYPPPGLNSM